MTWKHVIAVVLSTALVVGASVWFLQDARWERKIAEAPVKRDTVTQYLPYVLPKPDVTPSPAPSKPVLDEREAARTDSLLEVVNALENREAVKDSIIRELSAPRKSVPIRFTARSTEGIEVSGMQVISYTPRTGEFVPDMTIDSVRVPITTVSAESSIIIHETDWRLVVGVGAACMVAGAWIAGKVGN